MACDLTTSPYHPQANGLAEKSVQIIKRILRKAKTDERDPHLSLLEYRNTMINGIGSPAQLCMSRRLRSVLPCTPEQLAPKMINPEKVVESARLAQETNKKYYDRASKDLCKLQPNDSIRIQVEDQWVPGVVVKLADAPRSYIVRGPNGREYRRNHKHLRKVSQASETLSIDDDDENEGATEQVEQTQENTVQTDSNAGVTTQEPVRTSRGRIVKEPTRYQDFVRL